MAKLRIKKIIEDRNLDVSEIAQHLFPGNIHPRLALNRVIKGEGKLNSEQISKLAALANVTIEELYSGGWSAKKINSTHVFKTEEYEARLNIETWATELFHKNSLLHKSITHTGEMPLRQYLEILDSLIFQQNKK